MSLFVKDDGHYQGWLAAFLCCCAAVGSDEHPVEQIKSRPSTRAGTSIVTEQPSSYALAQRPQALQLNEKPDVIDASDHDIKTYLPASLPPLKPLDYRLDHGRPRADRNRPIIGNPTAFRRLGPSESQRQGLIPLRLAPVVLRDSHEVSDSDQDLSPVAADEERKRNQRHRSDSTQELLQPALLESYRHSRESPFQRLVRRSTDVVTARQSVVDEGTDGASKFFSGPQLGMTLSAQSSHASLQHQQSIEDMLRSETSPASDDSHRQSAPRLHRKHSAPTLLCLGSTSADAEQDALELNTITEEQKLDSPYLANSTNHRVASMLAHQHTNTRDSIISDIDSTNELQSNHVPAVAPSMQMEVRSQTLNDIGSAFSRPVAARSVAKDFNAFLLQQDEYDHAETPDRSRSRPAQQAAKVRSRSSSRVSGWLNSIRGGTANSADVPELNYNIFANASDRTVPGHTSDGHIHKHSHQASHSSVSTNADTPSATAASSPIANVRQHSRSLTAESRLTSPPSTIHEPRGNNLAPGALLKTVIGTAGPLSHIGHPSHDDSAHEFVDGRPRQALPARSRDSLIARTEQRCETEGWAPFEKSLAESHDHHVGIAL